MLRFGYEVQILSVSGLTFINEAKYNNLNNVGVIVTCLMV